MSVKAIVAEPDFEVKGIWLTYVIRWRWILSNKKPDTPLKEAGGENFICSIPDTQSFRFATIGDMQIFWPFGATNPND